VCLIARHLEGLGIATVVAGSALDILQAGQPPRSVFVDYPLGHSVGRPFDADNQRLIVNAALDALETLRSPGSIIELDCRWSDDDWQNEATDTRSGDTRAPRDESPQYQCEADRQAAEQTAAGAG
jgi:hypothetical protein